jgi:filamentous hemagglutinin
VPSNATLSEGGNAGNGTNQTLGGKSINDLSDAAKVPDTSDKSGELSAADNGR